MPTATFSRDGSRIVVTHPANGKILNWGVPTLKLAAVDDKINVYLVLRFQDIFIGSMNTQVKPIKSLDVPTPNFFPEMKSMSIRVLIADDHAGFRQDLRSLLERIPGLDVIGEASNGQEAVELVRAKTPDLVLMDLNMPVLNGIEATRQITAAMPGVRVVALTMNSDQGTVKNTLQAGATGFVLKDNAFDEIEPALQAVNSGRQYIGSGLPPGMQENM
jgi:CheY-like chemotaxis protein